MTNQRSGADPAGAALRQLSSRARRSNLARVAQLEDALRLAREGRLDAEGRHQAAELAHKVRGSAGTFGYPRASELAGELEQQLRGGLHDFAAVRAALATLAPLRDELQAD